MNQIKQILSFLKGSVFNCFSSEGAQTSVAANDSTNSLPISISLFQCNSGKGSDTIPSPTETVLGCENDLFLINKPSTYSKLLEDFTNHHGVDSAKVNQLVSPEITLADRVSNIHLIMGDTNPLIRHTLLKKESMNRLLENVNTLDSSLTGVEEVLTNHQDALRIAVEIIST